MTLAPERILEAVGFAAERLLRPGRPWREDIDEVLAALGQATGVSRVYVFENVHHGDGRLRATQRYEWVDDGASPQIDNPALTDMDYEAVGFQRWVGLLSAGEVIHTRVRDLPPDERGELEAEDILSVALVPVSVGPQWWGFIGFDDCVTERDWSAELWALRAAASTLSAAVQRERTETDLLEREAQYRQVFEQTGDGLAINDLTDGTLITANPAFCRMHGYDLEELAGKPNRTWIDPADHERRREFLDTVAAGHEWQGFATATRKDGSTFPVELRGYPFTFHGQPRALGVVRDDTERAHSFHLLETRVEALARIAASMTLDANLDSTLEAVAEAVVVGGNAVASAVHLLDEGSGDDLRHVVCHGLPDGWIDGVRASWELGVDAPTTRALREQELVTVYDAPTRALAEPKFSPLHHLLRTVEWSSIVVVPLDAAGRSMGAVNVYYRAGEEPSRDEIAFLRAAADQGAVAVENARLLAEAQRTAGVHERQRLARELHDSVSQALYGIALGARTARTLAERDPAAVIEPLDYVLSLAEAGLAEMRSLIFELRPESLEQEGLRTALERQAAAVRSRHGIAVETSLCAEPELTSPLKEALYRLTQEALHNVVKHAAATTVALRMWVGDDDVVCVEIQDDGRGFDAAAGYPGHLGLVSMRERIEAIGGTLRITSTPGEGTVVHAAVGAG